MKAKLPQDYTHTDDLPWQPFPEAFSEGGITWKLLNVSRAGRALPTQWVRSDPPGGRIRTREPIGTQRSPRRTRTGQPRVSGWSRRSRNAISSTGRRMSLVGNGFAG